MSNDRTHDEFTKQEICKHCGQKTNVAVTLFTYGKRQKDLFYRVAYTGNCEHCGKDLTAHHELKKQGFGAVNNRKKDFAVQMDAHARMQHIKDAEAAFEEFDRLDRMCTHCNGKRGSNCENCNGVGEMVYHWDY